MLLGDMKIIVRMPNYVGDVVLATPVLEALKRRYPEAEIVALLREPLADILEGNPHISEVWQIAKGSRRFFPVDLEGNSLLKKIRGAKFDLGVSLVPSFSAVSLFKRGKVKEIASFSQSSTRLLLKHASKKIAIHDSELHAVEAYLSVLEPLGIKQRYAPKLYIERKLSQSATLVIGINAGATRASKIWPKERFRAVAQRIVEDIPGAEVHFFGDNGMKEVVAEICHDLPATVVNRVGKTSLQELIAEIGGCDAFLSGDSGPMHIAASYKVPLVALFGSSNAKASAPYKWGNIINKRVDCSPCMLKECPIDHRCMKQIESDEVLRAVKDALLEKPMQNLAGHFVFEGCTLPKISMEKGPRKVDGKIGVIILAGGMGRRLGVAGPKGLVKYHGTTLFERILKKAGDRVIVLTSPMTQEATKSYLGNDVPLVMKGALPFVKGSGASPMGNGALFEAVVRDRAWQLFEDVTRISVVPVDNPLADPLAADMLSWEEELVVRAVAKVKPDESVGTLVEKEGALHVCEYSEIPDAEKKALNIDGSYKWQYGYSGMFTCSKEFFERAAREDLPYHKVVRESGQWLEKYVFDAFALARSYRVVLGERAQCFHPIKRQEDLGERV